jgi:hypothetical protein
MKFDTNKSVKGMVFAGCSFTWGQGLWYYSFSESIDQTTDENFGYHPRLYTRAHFAFKDACRYPRLVANHFDTYELVRPSNGGSNDGMIKYWNQCFETDQCPQESLYVPSAAYDYTDRRYDNQPPSEVRQQNPSWFDEVTKLNYEDVSHLIFQVTAWPRNLTCVQHDGETIPMPIRLTWDKDRPYNQVLLKQLEENNTTLGELHQKQMLDVANSIKEFLQKCESNGIKTLIMPWPEDMYDIIKNDVWMADRLISLDHNGNTFSSIEKLMLSDNSLVILKDHENFEVPPIDGHPSLLCHRIMADAVIKKINQSR